MHVDVEPRGIFTTLIPTQVLLQPGSTPGGGVLNGHQAAAQRISSSCCSSAKTAESGSPKNRQRFSRRNLVNRDRTPAA